MSIHAQTLIAWLEEIAPRRWAEDWDNVGLQVGTLDRRVDKVMLSLDVTESVVEEAIATGCQMIIAHHPPIFRPLRSLRTDLAQGRMLALLIKHDITVYAAHTNLDMAPTGGVNAVLADLLGLQNREPLNLVGTDPERSLGLKGSLPERISFASLIERVKEDLHVPRLRFVGDGAATVKKLAIYSGSGGEQVYRAAGRVDVLITGDVSYHQALDAQSFGLCVIDAGHYWTEWPIIPTLRDYLAAKMQRHKAELIISRTNKDVWSWI